MSSTSTTSSAADAHAAIVDAYRARTASSRAPPPSSPCQLGTFVPMWMTKAEFEEHGAHYIDSKCH